MLYVAISRVPKLSDLYILESLTPPKELSEDDPLQSKIKRLKEEKCLELSYKKVIEGDILKVIYQNVLSLPKNLLHIICDKWYNQADILIFSEFQTISLDNLTFDGFILAFRSHTPYTRSPKGIICFIRKELNFFIRGHIQKGEVSANGYHHIDLIYIKIN